MSDLFVLFFLKKMAIIRMIDNNFEAKMSSTYDDSNVFAKILRGEVPCKKVYEDPQVLAFYDIHPEAPTHVLLIPKGKYVSFHDFMQKADAAEITHFFQSAHQVAESLGLGKDGYRLVTNHGGTKMLQDVLHFHLHILGIHNK